jgi:hypothetical protein
MLDTIARALQLDEAERAYLFDLAQAASGTSAIMRAAGFWPVITSYRFDLRPAPLGEVVSRGDLPEEHRLPQWERVRPVAGRPLRPGTSGVDLIAATRPERHQLPPVALAGMRPGGLIFSCHQVPAA